jgi:hypothetical protein
VLNAHLFESIAELRALHPTRRSSGSVAAIV